MDKAAAAMPISSSWLCCLLAVSATVLQLATAQQCYSTQYDVNVRQSAGITSGVVTTLPGGTQVGTHKCSLPWTSMQPLKHQTLTPMTAV